jgi:hypothetical protein
MTGAVKRRKEKESAFFSLYLYTYSQVILIKIYNIILYLSIKVFVFMK